MLERDWQRSIARKLREQGAIVLVKQGNAGEGPGWPDLYVAHTTWTGWLELKIEPNTTTPRQAQMLKKLRAQGVQAYTLVWVDADRWDLRCEHAKDTETTLPGKADALLQRLAMVRERGR